MLSLIGNPRTRQGRRRLAALLGASSVGFLTIAALVPTVSGASPTVRPAVAHVATKTETTTATSNAAGAFHTSETLTRTNLVNGVNQVVDTRHLSFSVDQTRNLTDRQEIGVSWTGAHPTGGIANDPNSAKASQQEYPMVLMMCRGTAKTITPETCWTQTPAERFQQDTTSSFPPYRVDEYATIADRALDVNNPGPQNAPAGCDPNSGAQYWVPFIAVDGHKYLGGPNGCAGIPPEENVEASSLQPGNTTYAVTRTNGVGNDKFVITTNETNASLGCSDKVACALVAIPIMGISCDPTGEEVPPADRPSTTQIEQQAASDCEATGNYAPGAPLESGDETEALAVSGELWWSPSNWRNRITVPLTFAEPSDICGIVNKTQPVDIYGSYLMLQATQQWQPHYCLSKKLFPFQHVQTGEDEAKNLLAAGSIQAAFQGLPPSTAFTAPTVQSPTALTGFAVVYDIDTDGGKDYIPLRLDARLVAKLLTESYPSNPTIASEDTALTNPKTGQPNPVDMAADPEFQALNPGLPAQLITPESAATILVESADTDEMTALTSWINSNPEARAWLNGKPDPWGMVVNPAYKGIKLPVSSFPLLDTFESPEIDSANGNACLAAEPAPYLPLVASPVEDPSTITLDLQFQISDSQVSCSDPGAQDQKLVAIGRETQGGEFILGLTSLADAKRYDLDTAQLETQGGSTSDTQFTTAKGRTFVGPTDAGLKQAASLLKPNKAAGSFTVNYRQLETSAAGKSAYPGTMLMSTDVPTTGLPAATATKYANLLTFFAGQGQHPGTAIGQLAPGYLPMTAANGLGKEVAYAKKAAAAVADQTGKVPSVTGESENTTTKKTGKAPTSDSNKGNSDTGMGTAPGSTTTATGGQGPAAGTGSNGGKSSPGPGGTKTPTTSPNTKTTAVATPELSSGVTQVVVPMLLVLGLIAGLAALGVGVIGRRTA